MTAINPLIQTPLRLKPDQLKSDSAQNASPAARPAFADTLHGVGSKPARKSAGTVGQNAANGGGTLPPPGNSLPTAANPAPAVVAPPATPTVPATATLPTNPVITSAANPPGSALSQGTSASPNPTPTVDPASAKAPVDAGRGAAADAATLAIAALDAGPGTDLIGVSPPRPASDNAAAYHPIPVPTAAPALAVSASPVPAAAAVLPDPAPITGTPPAAAALAGAVKAPAVSKDTSPAKSAPVRTGAASAPSADMRVTATNALRGGRSEDHFLGSAPATDAQSTASATAPAQPLATAATEPNLAFPVPTNVDVGSNSKPGAPAAVKAADAPAALDSVGNPVATAHPAAVSAGPPAQMVAAELAAADKHSHTTDSQDSGTPADAAGAAQLMSTAPTARSEAASAPTFKVDAGVGTPDFGQGVANHVSMMIDNSVNSAKLQVTPPALGPIEVRIALQGDHAQVWLTSHSTMTRDALQDASPKLREMLNSQGFTQVSVDISQRSFQERTPSAQAYEWNGERNNRSAAPAISAASPGPRAANGILDAYA